MRNARAAGGVPGSTTIPTTLALICQIPAFPELVRQLEKKPEGSFYCRSDLKEQSLDRKWDGSF